MGCAACRSCRACSRACVNSRSSRLGGCVRRTVSVISSGALSHHVQKGASTRDGESASRRHLVSLNRELSDCKPARPAPYVCGGASLANAIFRSSHATTCRRPPAVLAQRRADYTTISHHEAPRGGHSRRAPPAIPRDWWRSSDSSRRWKQQDHRLHTECCLCCRGHHCCCCLHPSTGCRQ